MCYRYFVSVSKILGSKSFPEHLCLTALTLCVGIPSSSEIAHHLTGGQVTVEVLMWTEKKKKKTQQTQCQNVVWQ